MVWTGQTQRRHSFFEPAQDSGGAPTRFLLSSTDGQGCLLTVSSLTSRGQPKFSALALLAFRDGHSAVSGSPVPCGMFSCIPGLYAVPVAHTLTPPCCDNQKGPLRGPITLPTPSPHTTPTPTLTLCWSYPGDHSVSLIARKFCSQEDRPRRGEWGLWKDSGAGATVA